MNKSNPILENDEVRISNTMPDPFKIGVGRIIPAYGVSFSTWLYNLEGSDEYEVYSRDCEPKPGLSTRTCSAAW